MEGTHVIKLAVIFAVIIAVLWMKKPLWLAVIAGIITVILLYQISFQNIFNITAKASTAWANVSVILVLYCITFLQRMLEKRKQIMYAYQDLDKIFHNRRINATISALFIGLLPSAAAMILCGDIIKEASDGYLDNKEQAFVTSWFRHIPESTLPTYTSVLLMCNISGVPIANFMVGMIVPMVLMFLLAYFPYIRKIPKKSATSDTENGKFEPKNIVNLFKHLWTLLGILVLILAFNFTVLNAILIIIVLGLIVYKFKWDEIRPMFKNAIEVNMLVSTALVLILKEFIAFTGILEALPVFFGKLPIPMYMVFVLLFFVGTLISGPKGIIPLAGPIAYATIPNAGLALAVLIMSISHAANQIAPTHVCLVVATEYFGVSLGDLIKKSIPIMAIFCVLMIGYYHLLLLFHF